MIKNSIWNIFTIRTVYQNLKVYEFPVSQWSSYDQGYKMVWLLQWFNAFCFYEDFSIHKFQINFLILFLIILNILKIRLTKKIIENYMM